MSLSYYEKALSGFLGEQSLNAKNIVRECNRSLRASQTLRPAGVEGQKIPWGTIARAADYRIRYYFADTLPENSVARFGASQFREYGILLPTLWLQSSEPKREVVRTGTMDGRPTKIGIPVPLSVKDEEVDEFFADMEVLGESTRKFFEDLEKDVRKIKPARRRLSRDQEELLARYCYVLAIFDSIRYRLFAISPNSPLIYPEAKKTTEELLDIAENAWVEDLRLLSWAFYDGGFPRELLSCPAVLNPKFPNGSYGDLIVNGCLIDIKTTVRPELKREWIYQLLYYVLLDYEDLYHICEVGIYFARQQKLLRWSLSDLLSILYNDDVPSLSRLRNAYAVALGKSTRNS